MNGTACGSQPTARVMQRAWGEIRSLRYGKMRRALTFATCVEWPATATPIAKESEYRVDTTARLSDEDNGCTIGEVFLK